MKPVVNKKGKNMKRLIKSITYGITALLWASSCSDTLIPDAANEEMEGEIRFSSAIADNAIATRSIEILKDSAYEPLPTGYTLNIQMSHKEGTPEIDTKDGSALAYVIDTEGEKIKKDTNGTPTENGTPSTLKASETALYWPGNAIAYGFTATAGYNTIPKDQSDYDKLIAADRLLGYAGTNTDHNSLNYYTAKVWKAKNETTTIPLFMKHQCAMISVILKPGEGVWNTAVNNQNVGKTLSDTIFSYGHEAIEENGIVVKPKVEDVVVETPYHTAYTLEEGTGDNKNTWETTKFTAIVEPFDYSSDANKNKPITRIVINNQKYTFCATNDDNFNSKKDNYNLTPGKHLELVITVGRDGRLIHVYATEKDWEVVADNDFVTDDFGQGVDPVLIHRFDGVAEGENSLYAFMNGLLEDGKNEKGVVAILNNNINCYSADSAKVISEKTLNCTLNLNGCTLTTDRCLFNKISTDGVIKNGTIIIKSEGGTVESVVAVNNEGLIDKITTATNNTTITKAGIVVTNSKEIRNCVNNAKVIGDADYIGGIASEQKEGASITNCIVNSKVSTANSKTTIGGIVGKSENNSKVTGCTYEYGITIDQPVSGAKPRNNIIGETEGTVNATNNAWPTIAIEGIAGNNAFVNPYTAVIDCQEELAKICNVESTPKDPKKYRIADNFELNKTWEPTKTDSELNMKAFFEGNNKTITTNGCMIFNSITNTVCNLNIMLKESIKGNIDMTSGGCGGLAAGLSGGTLSNIVIRSINTNICIEAPNSGGIVANSSDGIITNCRSYVNVLAHSTSTGKATIYAGGIVAEATNTTINGCQVGSNVYVKGAEMNDVVDLYSGGIIGASNKDNEHDKGCIIIDCACFIKNGIAGNGDGKIGGIIGLLTTKGLKEAGIGNYWEIKDGVGKADANAVSIGKKNAIVPTELN